MAGVRRGPVGDLSLVVGWLAVLWAIFIVDIVLRTVSGIWIAVWLGLLPRSTDSLPGILTAHLLHANLTHIAMNSLGLLILGWASCHYSRSLTALAVLYSMLGAGLLTWLIGSWSGPVAIHIGASGVLFGLIGWLMANGIFRRDWRALVFAVLVVVLYGSALASALPSNDPSLAQVSWEMHLGGFIGGVLASWHLRKTKA
jgi:membrane associated rhomboid family serine protease